MGFNTEDGNGEFIVDVPLGSEEDIRNFVLFCVKNTEYSVINGRAGNDQESVFVLYGGKILFEFDTVYFYKLKFPGSYVEMGFGLSPHVNPWNMFKKYFV